MTVRDAERTDRERLRTIAHDSFRSSYSLSPQAIETILERVFGDEPLATRLDDPAASLLVIETSVSEVDGVAAFADVTTEGTHTIEWLHVDPQARGEGLGTALIERIRADAAAAEAPLKATVLEAAAEGMEFLERFGLEGSGNDQVTIGGEEFAAAVFIEGEASEPANEPAVDVPDAVTVEGTDRPLDRSEPVSGTEAPFFHIYADADADERFGYFCSQCASTAIGADGLDRLECGHCGNVHRADEWDDSYL